MRETHPQESNPNSYGVQPEGDHKASGKPCHSVIGQTPQNKQTNKKNNKQWRIWFPAGGATLRFNFFFTACTLCTVDSQLIISHSYSDKEDYIAIAPCMLNNPPQLAPTIDISLAL